MVTSITMFVDKTQSSSRRIGSSGWQNRREGWFPPAKPLKNYETHHHPGSQLHVSTQGN